MRSIWPIALFICLGVLSLLFAEPISKANTSVWFKSKRSVQIFGAILIIFCLLMLMMMFVPA